MYDQCIVQRGQGKGTQSDALLAHLGVCYDTAIKCADCSAMSLEDSAAAGAWLSLVGSLLILYAHVCIIVS
jgi:hypothetical protein